MKATFNCSYISAMRASVLVETVLMRLGSLARLKTISQAPSPFPHTVDDPFETLPMNCYVGTAFEVGYIVRPPACPHPALFHPLIRPGGIAAQMYDSERFYCANGNSPETPFRVGALPFSPDFFVWRVLIGSMF